MDVTDIVLTPLQPEHLDAAALLSRAAGWPHTREDWAFVLSLSRGTAAIDGRRLVGTAMTTRFGDRAATINMVIVDETMRGRGLGRRLMGAALAMAEGEVRLVATPAGLPLYETLGFRATGGIGQHQGKARPAREVPTDAAAWSDDPPLARLAELDRLACGMDRTALLARLAASGHYALLGPGSAPRGFAVLRPFGRGEVIGPVVAETVEDARALIAFAIAARPGAFLRVDAPDGSGLASWLAGCGLARVDEGVAMSRGGEGPPRSAPVRTFALAGQALG